MQALLCLFALTLSAAAEPASKTVALTVEGGKHGRPAGPVVVPLTVPAALISASADWRRDGGKPEPAQLTAPGLCDTAPTAAGGVRRELHLVLPALKAGETANVTVHIRKTAAATVAGADTGFLWKGLDSHTPELLLNGAPVLIYEATPLDDSTRERRLETYKVYHHLLADDRKLVTKGPGGEYTHHRGLFYGFRKTTYGNGTEVDTWHCTGDTAQVHDKTILTEAGPVVGRQRVVIDWLGKGKEVFAREERELTVWNVPGGRLVEFASALRPVSGTVKLDGDPQHAGFHFRASNEVSVDTKARVAAKGKSQTYFLRPDGPDKPGATRNWPDNKGHVNLPWDAMSFVLGNQRYTAAYLDRPDNPKEARYSERDYGRFGSYFVAEATNEKPVKVRYRVWLQRGEMSVADVQALSDAFVDGNAVAVKE
jgi:hypothetical protein